MEASSAGRRFFVGGSDARIIMGGNEADLIRLWREKRGEIAPVDLSGNLLVQLGKATEELNRAWYERNSGRTVRDVQCFMRHSGIRWIGGHPRRHCRRAPGCLRIQVHAALVFF